MRTRTFPSAMLPLLLMVCTSFYSPDGSAGHAVLDTGDAWVDSVYESLSRDERIAQLIMIPAYSNRDETYLGQLTRTVRKYRVGGVVFFQGGPARQVRITNKLQQSSNTPLLIAMDAEWGPGMRLDSTISYPKQMMLGAIKNDSLIWQMGHDVAAQLRRLGIHMNFAPVADINSNPDNPVINSRSFGENRARVARKAVMYMKGMQDNGLLCTAKHFPGHGDTGKDSHKTLPVIRHSLERLRSEELYPFRECVDEGISGIMVGHLSLPAIDGESGIPATMSRRVVTGLLREEMGFKGLAVTDALTMKGAATTGKAGDPGVRALQAGNDILLMPPDVSATISSVRREIRRGDLTWTDIEKKCKKVLAAKKWAGLDHYRPVELKNLDRDLHKPAYLVNRSRLIEASMTLVANRDGLLPVRRLDTLRAASLSLGGGRENEFQRYLDLYTDVKPFHLDGNEPDTVMKNLRKELDKYNLLIVSIHGAFLHPSGNYSVGKWMIRFVRELADSNRVVLTVFANPYLLGQFGDPAHYAGVVMGYEDSPLSREFAAQLIFGGIPASGRLPVSSGIVYPEGGGVSVAGLYRLKYALPEEAGLCSDTLHRIDSIVSDAIAKEATPGCQVLVARNGIVVYHKAFGYQTYLRRRPVRLDDLYDLASVTKITATLPSIMELVDEGRFSVEHSLSAYLPFLDTTNKGSLIIEEILSHRAGLKAWIPFYLSTLETLKPGESLVSRKLSPAHPFRLDQNTFINRDVQYKEGIYAREFSDDFPIQVADNLYMKGSYRDTIFRDIYASPLSGKKEYLYSDLGYYLLMQAVERITDSSLYSFAYHHFYEPIGATTMGYLPLNRFPAGRIVPTENDMVFRRQLLRGYVHDMGAAMLGGIAGHAGLFSDANDVAKMMQMYLQKGYYGGRRYLSGATVDLFNTCHYCSEGDRRGLGFDKPEPDPEKDKNTCDSASLSSFGHYGFTGIMTWADPEKGVLYVFLSNRVHPDQDDRKLGDMDVRTRIQQVVYNAIMEGTKARSYEHIGN